MSNTNDDVAARIARLSPEQRQHLERLLAEKRAAMPQRDGAATPSAGSRPTPRTEPRTQFPLSFAQERLWYLSRLVPDSPFYNIPKVMRLKGVVNVSALERAFNEIMWRHEALRTTFALLEDTPIQVVHPPQSLPLPLTDLQSLSGEAQREQLRCIIEALVNRPFSLEQLPLGRAALLQIGANEHILVVVYHHIVYDDWSDGVLTRELSTLYTAFSAGQPSPLPDLPVQYADYAVWQRERLSREIFEDRIGYWKPRLLGAPALLELPTDRPRPTVPTYRGALHRLELPPELTQRLHALGRQKGMTLFITLLTALNVLFFRYSGQDDIVIGSPVAGRVHPDLEVLVGFFVNTLALRTDLSGDPTVSELLGRVREMAWGAYARQDMPFEKLVEELAPQRSMSHSPLFQVMLVLLNTPRAPMEMSGLQVEGLESEVVTAKFDLTLTFTEIEGKLLGFVEYNTDLFDAATIQRMAGHLQTLLEGIVGNTDQPISTLPLLTPPEQQLLVEWNQTETDYPRHTCVHTLFEQQVKRTPDAVAVVFEQEQLTYRELNVRANQLAHFLQEQGVGPETLVGLCIERSLEMVVGILGILKAGGAYVPLDPYYPPERLKFMLEDTAAPMLLTRTSLQERLTESPARVICLDTLAERLADYPDSNPTSEVTADQLVYVMYTSGSTGRPKGVCVLHKGVVRLVDWSAQVFPSADIAGMLAATSLSFDPSVFELFVALCRGGSVLIAENALQLLTLPAAERVTFVNTVPSLMTEMLREGALPASVRVVALAGEALPGALVEEVYQQETVERVYNLYGPTETVYTTYAHIPRGATSRPPIGRPIGNTQVYVLDAVGQPVPVGVAGELYIGGDGLARGYLNRPELTAERFVPHPFSNEVGARLYRTGDRVCWLADGNLDYLGRLDHQVKIRGFRIELGEIEAVLGAHPAVEATVVLAREDVTGDQCLVAYIVPREPATDLEGELKALAREKLAEYMVPAHIVLLEMLPLTPNGKVDRKALPAPSRPSTESDAYIAPRTPTEQTLVELWRDVLGIDRIGIYDDFYALGGHSLLAMRLMIRVQQRFQQQIPFRNFVFNPTIAHLGAELDALLAPEQPEIAAPHAAQPKTGKLVATLTEDENRVLQELYDQIGQTETLNELRDWYAPPPLRSPVDRLLNGLPASKALPLLRWLVRQSWAQWLFWPREVLPIHSFHATIDTPVDLPTMVSNSLFYNLLNRYGYDLRHDVTPNPVMPQLAGLELLEQAKSHGCGVILVAHHSLAFSLRSPRSPLAGFAQFGIAGVEVHTHLRNLPLDKCMPILFARYLEIAVAALQRGEVVALAPDGDMGSSPAHEILFHGKRFRFYVGFAELALLTGAIVLPLIGEMEPNGPMTVRVLAPLDAGDETMPHAERVERMCIQYEQLLDESWRKTPWGLPLDSMHRHASRPR